MNGKLVFFFLLTQAYVKHSLCISLYESLSLFLSLGAASEVHYKLVKYLFTHYPHQHHWQILQGIRTKFNNFGNILTASSLFDKRNGLHL